MIHREKVQEVEELKLQQTGLEEAIDEFDLMNDDEPVMTRFGECFITLTMENVQLLSQGKRIA